MGRGHSALGGARARADAALGYRAAYAARSLLSYHYVPPHDNVVDGARLENFVPPHGCARRRLHVDDLRPRLQHGEQAGLHRRPQRHTRAGLRLDYLQEAPVGVALRGRGADDGGAARHGLHAGHGLQLRRLPLVPHGRLLRAPGDFKRILRAARRPGAAGRASHHYALRRADGARADIRASAANF